jgi:hypothetical protein
MRPKQEWPVADGETATVGGLYLGYVLPLAAIGPVAMLIGYSTFGMSIPFMGTMRLPFGTIFGMAVASYVNSLVGVFLLALVVNALAPVFGGQKSLAQALKTVVYANTAMWVAGIFTLIPQIGFLALLGLYSLYLLYLGLPVLMKSPAEKALSYTVVVIVCGIVLYVALSLVTGLFVSMPAPEMMDIRGRG